MGRVRRMRPWVWERMASWRCEKRPRPPGSASSHAPELAQEFLPSEECHAGARTERSEEVEQARGLVRGQGNGTGQGIKIPAKERF